MRFFMSYGHVRVCVLPNPAWVCLPLHSKANLLIPGCGEGKCGVYCRYQTRSLGLLSISCPNSSFGTCNKRHNFLHHNLVSIDWLYCPRVSRPKFGLVTNVSLCYFTTASIPVCYNGDALEYTIYLSSLTFVTFGKIKSLIVNISF